MDEAVEEASATVGSLSWRRQSASGQLAGDDRRAAAEAVVEDFEEIARGPY